jgi:hypothetical protein
MSEPGRDDAFYLPSPDGALEASPWTRGPWDVRMQHGGPPSALLARAVDLALGEERETWVPARTLVELLRPVPIARLRSTATIEIRGRQALRARAALEHEGVEIARARVLLVRAAAEDPALARGALAPVDAVSPAMEAAFPSPEAWPAFDFSFFLDPVGYHAAMELRVGDPWPGAAARAWSRMRIPLVAGEEPSGWERVLCFADAAHGVAPALDPARFTIVNPDLELSLARRPEGAWVGLDIRTSLGANAVGLTRSRVVDARGEAGAASASLIVRAR